MKKLLFGCATGLAALMTVAAVGDMVGGSSRPAESATPGATHLRSNENENRNRNRNANGNRNRNRNINVNRNSHMMSVQALSDVVGGLAIFGETSGN